MQFKFIKISARNIIAQADSSNNLKIKTFF